jgi:hypothetical protein
MFTQPEDPGEMSTLGYTLLINHAGMVQVWFWGVYQIMKTRPVTEQKKSIESQD